MNEQPATLATPAAVRPGTDAQDVAAATFGLCRKFLDKFLERAAGSAGVGCGAGDSYAF
jgi:hypothetical protein